MDRTTVWLNKERRDEVAALAGIPFSEWLRNQMDAYVKERRGVEAGRTQIDPTAIHGLAS